MTLRERLVVLLGGNIGGFKTFEEAIEHVRNLNDVAKKREVLTLATKRLYNTISFEDILKQNEDGSWMAQGKPLTHLEVKALKSEAQSIQSTRLWKLLDSELKFHCNQRVRAARTLEEVDVAKAIEFTFDILKTRLKQMLNVTTIE